jgi:hypothetical protein
MHVSGTVLVRKSPLQVSARSAAPGLAWSSNGMNTTQSRQKLQGSVAHSEVRSPNHVEPLLSYILQNDPPTPSRECKLDSEQRKGFLSSAQSLRASGKSKRRELHQAPAQATGPPWSLQGKWPPSPREIRGKCCRSTRVTQRASSLRCGGRRRVAALEARGAICIGRQLGGNASNACSAVAAEKARRKQSHARPPLPRAQRLCREGEAARQTAKPGQKVGVAALACVRYPLTQLKLDQAWRCRRGRTAMCGCGGFCRRLSKHMPVVAAATLDANEMR